MKIKKHICLLFLVLFLTAGLSAQNLSTPKYDLLIKNGRIIDGAGNPWYRAAIGISGGKIVDIGNLDESLAREVIDAGNQIVAPGFIDVHGHTENIFSLPDAENFIRMGVTSIITGNCGSSVTDVKAFLGGYAQTPLAVNLGTLIAHGAVRSKVLGLQNRAPSPAELAQMESIVDQAMKDGAVGLSTGLIYVPGTYAETGEVVALARVAQKHNGIYASHIRSEGDKVFEAIAEAINIGEQTGIPVQISHFKISSKKLWGRSQDTLGLVRSARAKGLPVTIDEYAYTASSTSLDTLLPSWALEDGRNAGRTRLADSATKKKIIAEMEKSLKDSKFKDYTYAVVADHKADPTINGKNIMQIAKLRTGKDKLSDQVETILELYKAGGAQMVYHKMDEGDVKTFMREPFTMIASDSGVRRFGEGVPHPRGYGNNVRVLGRYVREMKVISLEDAVRKMTSLPAQSFNLKGRGLLKPGYAADVVIFDENTVSDQATYENPHQYPVGINYVLVNGVITFRDGKLTQQRAGQALKLNQ